MTILLVVSISPTIGPIIAIEFIVSPGVSQVLVIDGVGTDTVKLITGDDVIAVISFRFQVTELPTIEDGAGKELSKIYFGLKLKVKVGLIGLQNALLAKIVPLALCLPAIMLEWTARSKLVDVEQLNPKYLVFFVPVKIVSLIAPVDGHIKDKPVGFEIISKE